MIANDFIYALRSNLQEFSDDIDSAYLKTWFAPKALGQLLCYRSLISNYKYQDVLKVILSRSARSSRLTTHYDLSK